MDTREINCLKLISYLYNTGRVDLHDLDRFDLIDLEDLIVDYP